MPFDTSDYRLYRRKPYMEPANHVYAEIIARLEAGEACRAALEKAVEFLQPEEIDNEAEWLVEARDALRRTA